MRPQRKEIDSPAYARSLGVDASLELALPGQLTQPKHTDDWVQTLLFPDQLRTRLSSVFKKAKEVEQETGVSTLHLAFGFLRNPFEVRHIGRSLLLPRFCCSRLGSSERNLFEGG